MVLSAGWRVEPPVGDLVDVITLLIAELRCV